MKTEFQGAASIPYPSRLSKSAYSDDLVIDQTASTDEDFIRMLEAFRPTGGIARSTELSLQLHVAGISSGRDFARWVVEGRLLCFEWNHTTWLPLFQFAPGGGGVYAGLRPVIAALRPQLSPWKITQWFAEPNVWLDKERPADALAVDSIAVLQAACAERFVLWE